MVEKFVFETKENEYKFQLDQFEGPLDLLLHLIKEAKIDIKDIFISKITEQYLKYMEAIGSVVDVEKAGEFVEMAATLIEIKSKQLLPKAEDLPEDEESPENQLIRRLEEYKLFKEQSYKLKKQENIDHFFKSPDQTVGDVRYVLKSLSFDGLLDSFAKLLSKIKLKAEIPEAKKIEKERFSVAQKIAQIKDFLLEKTEVLFSELFEDALDRIEVVNTFLALLELLKLQLVVAEQKRIFDEIVIRKNTGED